MMMPYSEREHTRKFLRNILHQHILKIIILGDLVDST